MKIIDNRKEKTTANVGDLVKATHVDGDTYYQIHLSLEIGKYVAISLSTSTHWSKPMTSIDDIVQDIKIRYREVEIIDKTRVTLTIE